MAAPRSARRWLEPVVLLSIGALTSATPAAADWDYHLAVVNAWHQIDEREAGVGLVEERGILGGLSAGLAWQSYDWRLGVDGELLGGSLDYSGATQLGAPHETSSDWRDRSLKLMLDRRLRAPVPTHVGATVRYRWQDRNINSTRDVPGLNEDYRTLWLGVRGLVKPAKALTLQLDVARALDSTARVAFDNDLDDASLDVGGYWRAAVAARLNIRHVGARTLYLEPFADWQSSPRTDSAPLTSGGTSVGSVFLPETEMLRFGITLGVRGNQTPER